MRRRQFITLILLGAAAIASATGAHGQQPQARPRQVGVLLPFVNENDSQVRQLWPAFKQRMHELGWDEDRNIHFDVHFTTQNYDRIRAGAAELVTSQPEVIVVWSNPGLAAMKQATQTIPVVFALVGDPVGSGLVQSQAHPGGNVTGFQNFERATIGKWLEFLKEVASGIRRVGVVYDQGIPSNVDFLHTAQVASTSMGVTIAAIDLRHDGDIEPALTQFAKEPSGGLVIVPNPFNSRNDGAIAAAAARLRLPAIYPFGLNAQRGGLISYGFDTIEQQRGAATYVDRILKGEKPGDLPVQAPTKYQLIINLKTAKALGLDVPMHLQQIADEVIE
jgi:putative ABC transport system substrate-binding protein